MSRPPRRRSRSRRGQTMVEYMLAISLLSVGIAVGFIYLSDSVKDSFKNARLTIQQPVP